MSTGVFYPPPRPWQKLRRVPIPPGLHHTPPIVDAFPVVVVNGKKYRAQEGTLRISHRVGAESRASFTILDNDGSVHLQDHQEVFIATNHSGPVPLFGGFIQSVDVSRWLPSGSRRIKVDCHGYRYLAEKRAFDRVYESSDVNTMVSGIVATELAEEFVIAGTASPPVIPVDRQEFNYESLADALDEIGRLTVMGHTVVGPSPVHWFIRPHTQASWNWEVKRMFDFIVIGDEVNGSDVDVDSSDILDETLRVQHFSPEYRNREFLTEAQQELTGKVETQFGDAQKRSFVLGYPVAAVPTVETDVGAGFVARTVGIRGVETGKDWYWNAGSEVVTQDSGGTLLGATHKIRVTYTGLADLVVIATDPNEVSRIAALEGSSGKVDRIDSEFQVIGTTSGTELARGRLKRWARRGTRISFGTRSLRYLPLIYLGGTNVVNIPTIGLSSTTMVIEAIEIFDDPANKLSGVRYHPTLVTQDAIQPGWEDSFRSKRVKLSRNTNVLEVVASFSGPIFFFPFVFSIDFSSLFA